MGQAAAQPYARLFAAIALGFVNPPYTMPSLGQIGDLLRRGDLALAIGVITILVVLVLPLPALLLDFALAISIILSVLILMTALFIKRRSNSPLFRPYADLDAVAVVAQPRIDPLIFAHGHEGPSAAGHVVEAFGNFVMAGNFIIRIIVFTILVMVNFVMITKGLGRIAKSRHVST
jgi:flagellar biosynthesis protein FlhA